MPYQFAIPADVIAPGGFVRFTMRYKPSYGQGGADHELFRFDDDSRLVWRNVGAKMVWRIGGDEIASAPLTFAAGQELTVEAEHRPTRRALTVSGATTGNGRVTADPLAAIDLPSTAYVLGLEDGGGSVLVALVPDLETFAEIIDGRILTQFDDTDGNRAYRDLAAALTDQPARFRDVALAVRAAFDLESAVGVQLDVIGSIVSLPREGATDARYKVLLAIQISLLLSAEREDGEWTGTAENVLQIARRFVAEHVAPGNIRLQNAPPYDYMLTLINASGIDVAELGRLVRFLRVANYAAVRGVACASVDVWGSGSVVIPHAGIWGSGSVGVPGASSWGIAAET